MLMSRRSKDAKSADLWIDKFCKIRNEHHIGWGRRRLKVAILDSGVDGNHPKIKDERKPGGRILGFESFSSGSAIKDSCGHGTHIVGILLDLAPNVDLYIVKITDSRDCDTRTQRTQIVEVINAMFSVYKGLY
jgi:hypothetical protein